MRTRAQNDFECVRSEGGLLTPDILRRIAALDAGQKEQDRLPGLHPTCYGTNLPLREATASAWNRVLGEWAAFRGQVEAGGVSAGPLTGDTRGRWLFPLFEALGFGRFTPARGLTVNGKVYPISHQWEEVPIHLVGSGVDLDRRAAGVAGAAKSSPHSLVQEYLNAAGERQWGIVSNGRALRLLRNSHRVARQQLIEFDLERMMEGQSYDDFVVLWLVCHRSRFEPQPDGAACWLEQWSEAVAEVGVRALEDLQKGVTEAITALGSGFLAPANRALRDRLRSGDLTTLDFYQQALRLVYRLIFLAAAEDRDLLFADHTEASKTARERYTAYYSTQRLRRLAARTRGDAHGDLYAQLRQVFAWLGSDDGFAPLALPALDSFLFAPAGRSATPDLDTAQLSNSALLAAIRSLSAIEVDGQLRPVSFRDLSAEEFGGVYESLLAMHPEVNVDAQTFSLGTASGNERKSTGSYYTPTSLITSLLDTALAPVIRAALDDRKGQGAEARVAALLRLRIVDPACGSGHFLIAAAHRLAHEVARLRTGETAPAPEATRAALREVITHCVYGVDVNPMAVELCKVSLWLDALEPGKPLSFLDHHIKCGNAILGAPAIVNDPEFDLSVSPDAFTGTSADEKRVASGLKRRLRAHAAGQAELFTHEVVMMNLGNLATEYAWLGEHPQNNVAEIRVIAEEFARQTSPEYYAVSGRLLADAWCSAFFWPLDDEHAEDAPSPRRCAPCGGRPTR